MVTVAKMNVLSVGRQLGTAGFDELPIRVVSRDNGHDAVRSFKTEQIDSVISCWHLPDMPDGMFLRKLKAVKPEMPTIAIVEADNPQQEIDARVLGVSAVICDDCGRDFARAVVCEILGLSQNAAVNRSDAYCLRK